MPARPKNLLLCFDAFGTLFLPKKPIAEQYTAVARQCGLNNLGVADVEKSFHMAFSKQLAEHPNYGRESGMGAEGWWTAVITNTFTPWIPPNRQLPPSLVPNLLHRFSSAEGYDLTDARIPSLLGRIKHHHRSQTAGDKKVIIGVITNSDDRVPDVLASLGLRISPARYPLSLSRNPSHARRQWQVSPQNHVDFHCMSYDVGFSKPDRRIFDAAEVMARRISIANGCSSSSSSSCRDGNDEEEWIKVYVGDEWEKDALGATRAGWNAVHVAPAAVPQAQQGAELIVRDLEGTSESPEELFPDRSAPICLRAASIGSVLEWFAGSPRPER
ncbi:hypothetical protein QBC47DRAFT_118624 [Echria macrotheca]|uniref:Haloacid dehalogenase n=1 Tax=Echria macrotheca TaxID=438768 RepID=A0AAJ0B720_9PEZI|nr:hypothetical protein QBC47DRAFT_118624 [Echria macrotheca]